MDTTRMTFSWLNLGEGPTIVFSVVLSIAALVVAAEVIIVLVQALRED